MLRQLREDARDFPATMILGSLWVVVFLAMLASQWTLTRRMSTGEFLLGLRVGHRFGDMTLQELFAGELWRTVTATFVHYGFLHIGMNLYALYHLGCLVESWYGSGPFVVIYVLTGGVGNLLSGFVRQALHWDPTIPSGGGSVVVMGLVGLCAVVGWRAGTRLGDYLRNQMVWVLLLTALIGLVLPLFGFPIIDNWGHACGAGVGSVIGLANTWMIRQVGQASALWGGRVATLAIAACAAAQVADNRAELADQRRQVETAVRTWAESERRLIRMEEIRTLYRTVALPRLIVRGSISRPWARGGVPQTSATTIAIPLDAGQADLDLYNDVVSAVLKAFDSLRESLDFDPGSVDYRRARSILEQSLKDPPTLDEYRDFDERMVSLEQRVRVELEAAKARALQVTTPKR